ncbi:Core-2/I-branching beta-1,6-N-acetylglucosaminyltransferase family protein isoform 2 [Hibiscus syriacus]|uniref:Core-2/I-branching beta-1,6-N-acetylglucosaminyltransferase family protein isoform 2 n=1 Tax=Hibiscus syriacus TaxID=106335 RepID=A0A6A3AZY3_HIBSY|nr:Core-2/I-branching beta-1,6-N-acetylglucosaminyltransferase family protein isoform 2 [Hibiscus syriacus]
MSAVKRKPVQQKSQIRWKRKVLAVFLVSLCPASLVLVEMHYSRIGSDRIGSLASLRQCFTVKPKIAILFIARNRLPLDMVWDAFFKVDWGEATMIEAELTRFLLSCIPIYNFSYMYDYIMSTPTSFVDSFADTKEGQYNPKMDPVIPVYNWRKGSQWVVLTRKHAEVVKIVVFIVTECRDTFRHFKLTLMLPSHVLRMNFTRWNEEIIARVLAGSSLSDPAKEHNCIPDEHYVQTLLAQEGFEGEITRRSLTYSAWDLSASKDRECHGWHAVTYKFSDATPELIKSIKDIDNIHYETENRREWCRSKGKPAPCFLFARKFTRPAALHLLNLSLIGARRGAKSGT